MGEAKWLGDDEQRLWRAYLDATRLLFQNLDKQLLRDSDISFTDFEILVLLSEAPDRRMRMRDLADASTTTRSGITRAVSRMENAGWVRRVECESDRRGAWAELTDVGYARLAEAGPGHVEAVRENMFDLLSPDDVTSMAEAFTRMRDRMIDGRR
ncbi:MULTISPECIES: MarR family winged helix-turn-helix transcriptional regulator [Rhodococcus]|uniref:DNA-binding MarR family transcriptional regulator n=1 Tax=Rhodococcus rhodochrous J45 TaxID=935266 RepID=A0A562E5T3_RHORH|nr:MULTISPECIES: MarR family transcriptional regulator [Rhodococcus]MXQ77146.1 MarR family transcriptional regulator [Rhodococcus rhodochrous]TWH17190.1 DNA-binding MarR family transcriptional regulator [Rhodococcus rhodochrous J45]BDB60352.1 MarR family transcriptional regulator [Rhodococcus sp. RDE2]